PVLSQTTGTGPRFTPGPRGGMPGRTNEGIFPASGRGAIEDMQPPDQHLDGELANPTPGERNLAEAQLRRESYMIDVWLQTQGDFVAASFGSQEEMLADVRRRITERLERAAGLR